MKLFARLFGRSRRTGGEPEAQGGSYTPAGHVPVDQVADPRISFGQPSTAGRGSGVSLGDTGTFASVAVTGAPRQESDMVVCTVCGFTNPPGARFCNNCGTRLSAASPGYGGDGERAAEQTSTISISGIEALDAEPQQPQVLTPEAQAAVEALPPGTALLVVRRGPNSGSRFLLDADRTTAGRHPESDIFLDDVTVSRRHAEFRRTGTGFSVADVGSLNGTYVGRQRIDEFVLSPGDEVQIGKYRLVFFPSRYGQAGSGETG